MAAWQHVRSRPLLWSMRSDLLPTILVLAAVSENSMVVEILQNTFAIQHVSQCATVYPSFQFFNHYQKVGWWWKSSTKHLPQSMLRREPVPTTLVLIMGLHVAGANPQ